MDRIRVGVVGLRHGMASVKEVLTREEFELVALCSHSSEAYEYLCGRPIPGNLDSVTFTEPREVLIEQCRLLKEFKEVDFFTDYDRFLEHKSLDAVILAVPIPLNADFAIKALAKNKHVFASKPFALTLQQGIALKEAVLKSRNKFVLNYQFRYSQLMQNIRNRITAGALGKLQLMWWNMFRMPFRAGYTKWEASGGAFLAEICHWIDLFQLFNSEQEFKKVCAFGGLNVLTHHQEVDDNAVCIIEYANNVRASINFTYFTDQPKHSLFGLVGDGGKMIADTDDAGRYILYNGPEQNKTEYTANTHFAHQGHLGFDVSHKRFAEVILQDLDINEDEANRGFESLVVSLAAQMSVNQGKIVTREDILAVE
jgi:predicted dehydrogenase